MAEVKIPLPRVPPWVIRGLDRYSDWAAKPVWSVVHRRDLVTVAVILGVSSVYALWADSWMGFVIGVSAGLLTWVALEAYQS
jgi:hypothetical protein